MGGEWKRLEREEYKMTFENVLIGIGKKTRKKTEGRKEGNWGAGK